MADNDGDDSNPKNIQHLNNNFKSKNLRYLVIYDINFRTPIYCLLNKQLQLKVFINQEFKEHNEFNLKNLLMSLLELASDVVAEQSFDGSTNPADELKLMIYLKKCYFESVSKILIKNLGWLGGKLILDDSEGTNRYNDWYIMEFEV